MRCVETDGKRASMIGTVDNDGADKVPAAELDGGFNSTVICRLPVTL